MPETALAWVRQEDAGGCGVAVLAMLTGSDYASVSAELAGDPWNQWSGGDSHLSQPVLERYLAARGWFFRRVYSSWEFGEWPPRPFAERHYAIVANPGGGHFVAVDAAGAVLDPLREGTFALTDWDVVNCVVGLTRGS